MHISVSIESTILEAIGPLERVSKAGWANFCENVCDGLEAFAIGVIVRPSQIKKRVSAT
jgi:hypothetical protein